MMSKRWFRTVWLLIFMGFSSVLWSMQFGYKSNHTRAYFVDEGHSVTVLEGQRYFRERNANGSDFAFASVIYEPDIYPGPFRGVLELYFTESAFAPGYDIYSVNQILTQTQEKQVHQALIQHANADPDMAKYRPGQPAQTRFSMHLITRSCVRLGILAFISYLLACGVRFFCNIEIAIRKRGQWNRYLKTGLCIRCGYSCKGLESKQCPECGQVHDIPAESTA